MKKLAVQLIKELTSLSDTIPAGFKGFFAKSSGLFWKNSDGTEKQIITNDLVNQDVRTTSTPSFETITANKITGVKSKLNTVSSNLGSPTVEEMSLFHGQFNNKMRFVPALSQEESIDGITWVTSNRATANNLADLMLGEGNTTNVNILPLPTVGSSAYYRLTWNSAETGYVYLNTLYLYLSSSGNNVNIKIEKYNILNDVWTDVASGIATGWPNHTYIPHTTIPFYPTITTSATHFGKVRITFSVVNSANANTIPLYAIEWFGGYPAARRNLESVDRNRNVYFPNLVVSNESINFDANIEPTQTGSAVTKTSTWMWQYLAQGIKWLRANFANYSLITHNHTLASLSEKNYSSLTNIPTSFTPAAHNHTLSSLSEKSYNSLTDKPTIPSAQVQTDWNATTGLGVLLNKPTSLPANGGNADTLAGFHASEFAKIDTAFTAYANIPGNNATTAVFVINTNPADWSSTDLVTLADNDLTLPSGTSNMILILQPGIYSINSIIDFAHKNVIGIIGLSKETTIIDVADSELVSNLMLLENISINVLGNTTGTLFGSSLNHAIARNVSIRYTGNLGYDLETMCFNGYKEISDIKINGIVGATEKSHNINNVTHICDNINNYSGFEVFKTSENINNVVSIQSSNLVTFWSCSNISNTKIEIGTIASAIISSVLECTGLSNVKVFNAVYGFTNCYDLVNCSSSSDVNNVDTIGFNTCYRISNSSASTAYVGFSNCLYISNSFSAGCGRGYEYCNKLSTCMAKGSISYGYYACSGMVNNIEHGGRGYNGCYADNGLLYATADTPNGGFNS